MNNAPTLGTDVPGIIIEEDMNLRLDEISRVNFQRLQIRGTILLKNGRQNEFAFEDPGAATLTTIRSFFGLPTGILLNATIINPALAGLRGSTYVQLSIQKGRIAGDFPFRILSHGYITDRIGLSWPPGQFELPGNGRGEIIGLAVPDPAAGAQLLIEPPSNQRWRLHSISFLLTTDANAGDRNPFLDMFTASQGWKGRWFTTAIQTASQAFRYTFSAIGTSNKATAAAFNSTSIPIPAHMWFDDNPDVTISVNNMQAGDQISDASWTREALVQF